MGVFDDVLDKRPNQVESSAPTSSVVAGDLRTSPPHQARSGEGVRLNVSVGIQYIAPG